MKKRAFTSISAITLAALISNVQAANRHTVHDKISGHPDHALFSEPAAAVGLDELARRDSGLTLVLPTDHAPDESAIDVDAGEPLSPEETEWLQNLLRYHIVPDEFRSDTIYTLDNIALERAVGDSVFFDYAGDMPTGNSASLLPSDLIAVNSLVHVIDSMPGEPGVLQSADT